MSVVGNSTPSEVPVRRVRPPWIIRFFSSERHAVMTLIVVLSVLGLSFGVVQTKENIVSTFRLPELPANLQAGLTDDDAASLQQKDTDQDSLTDFDELYVHQTSPYVQDSDSDGLQDSAEVKAGSDPNCPIGKICGSPLPSEEDSTSSLVDDVFGEQTNPDAFNSLISGGEVGPDQLRAIMRDSGAPGTVVDALSDEAIVNLFSASAQGEEPDLTALRNLGAADIRVLLKAGGGEDELIDEMDDDSLIQIYQQAIDQQVQLSPS